MNSAFSKKEKKVVELSFFIVFLNMVIESVLQFFNDRTLIILTQFSINIIFFAYLSVISFNLRFNRKFYPAFLLILLLLLFSLASSDIIVTLNMLLKFSIPYFFLLIGYSFNSLYFLDFFLKRCWILMAYFCLYITYVNLFDVGLEMYSGGMKIGYYSVNGLYVPIFALLMALFLNNFIKNKSLFATTSFFSILTAVITFAMLKRTLILLLLFGIIMFLAQKFSLKRLASSIFFLTISFIVFRFFTYDRFMDTFQSRESRFSSEYSILNEGRITENVYVFSALGESSLKLFLGSGEVFNDRKYISYTYYEEEREIHNSYVRMLWNAGIFGLSIFLLFYWIQLKTFFSTFKRLNEYYPFYKKLFFFGLCLVSLRILNDFSSGITYLGFNIFSFLIIGNLFRIDETLTAKSKLNSLKRTFTPSI
mgnify:CR=1 FL=1